LLVLRFGAALHRVPVLDRVMRVVGFIEQQLAHRLRPDQALRQIPSCPQHGRCPLHPGLDHLGKCLLLDSCLGTI